jgi:hypothetical protein
MKVLCRDVGDRGHNVKHMHRALTEEVGAEHDTCSSAAACLVGELSGRRLQMLQDLVQLHDRTLKANAACSNMPPREREKVADTLAVRSSTLIEPAHYLL